ncbi:MAG: type II toxin-antitoxin system RelE/ParE family toxin [Gammaproteobacteria bacterium]
MRVRWLRSGLRSIEIAGTYIAADNPQAAARLVDTVRSRAQLLADNPKLGRVGRIPGTREMILGGMSFLIVYRLTSDEVQILRLLHTSQEFP